MNANGRACCRPWPMSGGVSMVGSLLHAGLQGVQGGLDRVERAAVSINGAAARGHAPELSSALVSLRAAEVQAEAGVAVLRTANDLLGRLIDTHA